MKTFNRKWKQEEDEEANSDSYISFKKNTEIYMHKGVKVKENPCMYLSLFRWGRQDELLFGYIFIFIFCIKKMTTWKKILYIIVKDSTPKKRKKKIEGV